MDSFAKSLPTELWMGAAAGRWPLHVWENADSARRWLEQDDEGYRRRVWRVTLAEQVEQTLIPPVQSQLTDIPNTEDGEPK